MELRVVEDAEAAAREARREILAAVNAARESSRSFVLGLAGGQTPRRLYELLAAEGGFDWSPVHFVWGDERCVPPGDPASNYRLAHESLLSRIDVDAACIHRMRGDAVDPDGAAREYEEVLAGLEDPDLVLLGLGTDGHTASLFPRSPALEESLRLVTATSAPAGAVSPRRLTLTFPGLARFRRGLFLVTGTDKRTILTTLREDPTAAERLPAARVRAREGELWIVDRAAAPQNLPHGGGPDR